MCSLSGVMTLIPGFDCWAKAANGIIVSPAINGTRKTFITETLSKTCHFSATRTSAPNKALVDAAIMSSGGHSRARKIWIDDALGGAARCRRVALRQRPVAAFVIVVPAAVHEQANRISRIIGLGPSRRRRQNRRGR